jgi:peptidoglycan/LPS O-acetylase OafA/YrhL
MEYRKEIDGLRAIAVVPVIFFHAGISYFTGGFIGVDIFFVISGYLITSIVISEIGEGRFSMINFYERRARRIMPMLFFILLVSSIFAWLWLLPSDMKSFSYSMVSVVFFSSNINFYVESGYWDIASELKPLLHTWSLAAEEQYYLIFPLFLFLIKRLKKSTQIATVLCITIVSLGLAQWASIHAPTADFYLLPTRFWELALGALIGIASVKYGDIYSKIISNTINNEIMGFIGIIMIFSSILLFTKSTPFPGFVALLPTIGATLIIVFASNQTIIGRLLGLSPVVMIGLISYSAYLWHQPILAFAKYQSFPALSQELKVILVILVFPLSYLSWKFIETPFRNKAVFNRKKIFTYWISCSIVFAAAGLIGIVSNGFENRKLVSSKKILDYQPDNKILQKESISPLILFAKEHNSSYETVGSEFDNALWYDTLNRKPKVLVIGNSHGENFYNIINCSDSIKSQFQLARYGYQIRFFSNTDSKIFSSPNYKYSNVVVICSRLNIDDFPTLDPLINKLYADGKVVVLVKNVFLFNVFGSRTIADFMIQKEISKGANLNDPNIISNLVNAINKEYYKEFKNGRINDVDRLEAKTLPILTSKYKNLILLDRMDYMCDYNKKLCFVINDKLEKFIFDDGHASKEANPFYAKRIEQLNWMKLNLISSQLKQKREINN